MTFDLTSRVLAYRWTDTLHGLGVVIDLWPDQMLEVEGGDDLPVTAFRTPAFLEFSKPECGIENLVAVTFNGHRLVQKEPILTNFAGR